MSGEMENSHPNTFSPPHQLPTTDHGCTQKQTPPSWTKEIGALQEPFYLLQSAEKMKRLRLLCETQSPEPMRRRHLYAPPNFLEFA